MPSKNEDKIYIRDGYYHLYNRGVEKRIIFSDSHDYTTFLSYLKTYLLPKDEDFLHKKLVDPSISSSEKNKALKLLRMNNFSDELTLLAYCLMPNHFHLLVHQTTENTIDKFMNSLGTRYSMYFNRKYNRVGPLFQGVYKAVMIESDEQLLHLTRYIHVQSFRDSQGHPLRKPLPSSYSNYLNQTSKKWVKPGQILSFFQKGKPSYLKDVNSYKSFVENIDYNNNPEFLQTLTLE